MEPPSKRARGFEDEDAPPEVLGDATADATADAAADAVVDADDAEGGRSRGRRLRKS